MRGDRRFNPLITEDALKQWWGGNIKIANKTVKGPNMSGMSPDDGCKERMYRVLDAMAAGNKDETGRMILERELDMLATHALELKDGALVGDINIVQKKIFELYLGAPDFAIRIEEIKADIYRLETY